MKYIIDFVNSKSDTEIRDYMTEKNITLIKTFNTFDKTFLVESAITPQIDSFVESFLVDSPTGIELMNTVMLPTVPGVVAFPVDADNWWKTASIRSPNYDGPEEEHTVRGAGINVYIMDSGIDAGHVEFMNTNINLLHSFTGEFSDTRGHGTAMASIIAGDSCGLTNANLHIVKIFDNSVPTLQSDLIAALDAISTHAISIGQPAIVNMSWNIAHNTFIDNKITQMIAHSIFVVAAAGNDGAAIADRTPASNPLVLTIGAYNQDLNPCDFTNFNGVTNISNTSGATNSGELDGWAPGVDIKIALPGGGYGMAAGTSAAAAIHSGALAYNMSTYILSTGDVIVNTEHNRILIASSFSLSRVGLLTLGGAYSSAVNKVSTYNTKPQDKNINLALHTTARVGEFLSSPICNQLNVLSMTPSIDLPAGLYIDNGFLVGIAEDIPEPAQVHEFTITTQNRDGSSTVINMILGVIKADVDLAAATPGSDPQLDIILSLPYCCQLFNSGFGDYCYLGTSCQYYDNYACDDPDQSGKYPTYCFCHDVNDAANVYCDG